MHYKHVEECLDRAVMVYRARVLRERLRGFELPFGRGFSLYLSLVHPPRDIAPSLDRLLDYVAALRGAGLRGLEIHPWFETVIKESYEAGGPRFVYPMLYVILEGKPCRNWMRGGCIMCGYNLTRAQLAEPCTGWRSFLSSSYSKLLRHPGAPLFMVSTRGSFFDEWEISRECRSRIVDYVVNRLGKYLHTETRGDVVLENLDNVRMLAEELEDPAYVSVGVGLESVFDEVLRCAVNKHESMSEILEAIRELKKLGFYTMAYIFTPKPLLNMVESVYELAETIRAAEEAAGPLPLIVFPLGVHRASLVEYLYLRGRLRPPSLVEFARILYSLPRSLLRHITNLQHVPTVPGPIPLVPNVDPGRVHLRDLVDIHLFASTGDPSFLERILARHSVEPIELPETQPWSPGEVCERASQLCREVLSLARAKDLGAPRFAAPSKASTTVTSRSPSSATAA